METSGGVERENGKRKKKPIKKFVQKQYLLSLVDDWKLELEKKVFHSRLNACSKWGVDNG